MVDVRIQRVNPDLDCLRDIAVFVHEILLDVYEHSPWSFEQTFADLLRPESVYFLAFSGEEAVAFISATEVMDEVEITNIAVKSGWQGQGISADLLARLLAFEGNFFLEVRRSNVVAQGLYRKFGFVAFHERKGYYRNPVEDAILMRLERL